MGGWGGGGDGMVNSYSHEPPEILPLAISEMNVPEAIIL